MKNNLQVWHEKVNKSRFITSCLRTDLKRIDNLYGRLAGCSYELYKLRKEVDVEYISVSGVVTCKDEKTSKDFTEKEKNIKLEIATLKKSVDDIVASRTKLITSELYQWKNKRGRDYCTKQKERRHIRGGHVIVGELRLTLSCYLNLVKERDALVSNDLQVLIYEDRVKDEHLAHEKERQRDRENLHNFTTRVVSRDERQILNNGGGFVLKDKTILDDRRKHRTVKRQTELAVLSYVEYLAGLKVKGRRMKGGGGRMNVRKEIMRYYFHPRVGYLERRFINKALKLADFYSIKSVRSNLSIQVRGMSSIKSGLKLLEDLNQDNSYILRESDKNLGWSLNTSTWYNQEYDRHLKSGFYQRVGSMGDVDNIKNSCRLSLQAILKKHIGVLSTNEYKSFNLGNGIGDYILPSLNLSPKVHKLRERACMENEKLLTGRPIITGYGWCTIEASKFLQRKLRSIMGRFKDYLVNNSLPYSILGNSYELVGVVKRSRFSSLDECTFLTFDFKDLYTNILFKDASTTLKELALILGIEKAEVDFLLDLYSFCNTWNYFNVGNCLHKQVKGVSMGCYFSKEISDLVLLYSEYKYSLVCDTKKVIFLKRYADDGIILFLLVQ